MDFFTIPTLTFGFCIAFSSSATTGVRSCTSIVTRNPNALWIVQQLEEGWAYKQPHRFLPFDRDSMFGADVVSAEGHRKPAHPYGLSQSLAERCCRTLGWKCRRDLLDHVIVLNERHLKWLMSEYVLYYHEDRIHLGLAKDTPAGRPIAIRSEAEARSNPCRDSADSTTVMRMQHRRKAYSSDTYYYRQGTAFVRSTFFASIFRRPTNQPTIPN